MKISRLARYISLISAIFMVAFLFCLAVLAQDLVNINTASQTELETLNGIGPSKAAAIIAYREENGPFENIEDIMNVSGIGQATFDNIKDFIYTDEPLIAADSVDIVINELLPNPSGSDDFEWIELKNIGQGDVDLAGWKISDTSRDYVISSDDFSTTIIQANGFFILEKQITDIALNNSGGETVQLFNVQGELISQTSYSDIAVDDTSWARDLSQNYQWTTSLTKGSDNNIIQPQIEEPLADQVTSDVTTPSAELLQEEIKDQSIYKDKVSITEFFANPVGIDDKEWIEIYNSSDRAIDLTKWKLKDNNDEFVFPQIYLLSQKWLILDRSQTGLVLNNIGGDYLELIDKDDQQVFKISYTQKVPESQSYNYCTELNQWLWLKNISPGEENLCPPENEEPFAYFEIEQEEIMIDECITLDASESYDYDGQVVKYIWEFSKPVKIFNMASTTWEFIDTRLDVRFTQAGENKITLRVVDDLAGEDKYVKTIKVEGPEEEKEIEKPDIPKPPEPPADLDKQAMLITLSDVRKLEMGSYITTQGYVATEPGLMGKTIFYIIDEQSGIQIYSYHKDFPALGLGDLVEVTGELSQSQGESRIKTKTADDIRFLSLAELPEALDIQIEDVGEELEGALVKVRGEITEIKGSSWWLDDKTAEVKIYLKQNTQISNQDIQVGDSLEVTGIVSQWQDEYRILPRYPDDVKLVLGEDIGITQNTENTKTQEAPDETLKYLLAIVIAILIILVSVIIKQKR